MQANCVLSTHHCDFTGAVTYRLFRIRYILNIFIYSKNELNPPMEKIRQPVVRYFLDPPMFILPGVKRFNVSLVCRQKGHVPFGFSNRTESQAAESCRKNEGPYKYTQVYTLCQYWIK